MGPILRRAAISRPYGGDGGADCHVAALLAMTAGDEGAGG